MKKIFVTIILCTMALCYAQAQQAKVYFTKEITPESLVKIYESSASKSMGAWL